MVKAPAHHGASICFCRAHPALDTQTAAPPPLFAQQNGEIQEGFSFSFLFFLYFFPCCSCLYLNYFTLQPNLHCDIDKREIAAINFITLSRNSLGFVRGFSAILCINFTFFSQFSFSFCKKYEYVFNILL